MIGSATTPLADTELPKAKPNLPPDRARGPGPGACGAAAYYSSEVDALHLKYTSKDGDTLEVDFEHREETFSAVAFSAGPARPRDALPMAGANAEAAQPAKAGADDRLAQLARLRDWAARIADEVRKQQHRILEEYLKRSGKFMPGSEGRFILVQIQPAGGDEGREDADAGVPDYWNAENTSDRIVHFATQMAEIAGGDTAFAETIIQAVADGFDQANAETGPLPGAAGELNKKTRDLTFSKLSKWLEERKAEGYNQGARKDAIPTSEVPYGTQDHEQ